MFNRDSAFSMEVRDPDNPDDNTRIVDALVIDDEMLIFKTTGIYRNLTADTIDPHGTDENTRHSVQKLYSIGASNVLVARVILQFKEMVPLAISNRLSAERLISHVWAANKLLLQCEEALYQVYAPTMDLLPKCDELIELHKRGMAIPALPQAPNLDGHASQFLISGKKFLEATYALLGLVYDMPSDRQHSAFFRKHREWVRVTLGEKHPIHKLLVEDEGWVRIISELSNAIRHEEDGQRIELQNFHLQPGNKFSGPAWRYDLIKKGLGKQGEYTDLLHDMNTHLQNMHTFFEEFLLLCLDDRMRHQKLLSIYRRPASRIRPECPILYEVALASPVLA